MIKKIVLGACLVTMNIFAQFDDYTLFSTAQEKYNHKRYQEAEEDFKKLVELYPQSALLESQYAHYYIGLNYYNLAMYKEAIAYLTEAIYLPSELKEGSYFGSKRRDFFQYEREYYIAKSYDNLDDKEEAIRYYRLLLKPYFELDLEPFRQKALLRLEEYDDYYTTFSQVYYDYNLENIAKLELKDLLGIGDYLFNKGKLDKAVVVYSEYLKREKDIKVEGKMLESLFRQKKHNEVIEVATKLNEANETDTYNYYIGNSNRRLGRYDTAIEALLKVSKDSSYYPEANHILGRLYSVKKNYEEALKHLNISGRWNALELEAEIFYKVGKKEDYKRLKGFIDKYKYWDISSKYRYKLYELEGSDKYLEDIIKYNANTYYYELALEKLKYKEVEENYPIEQYNKKYYELNDLLQFLSDFTDKNLSKIAIDQYEFPKEDKLYMIYLRVLNYEERGDYYHALNLAIRNQGSFYRYDNLRRHLYPEHYSEYVEKYSSKHGIEAELAYSIIRQESHFNTNVISSASAYGLMQTLLSTAQIFNKNLRAEDLLEAENSINYGIQYLSQLFDNYNGSIATTAASYNGGPGNVKRWARDGDGDIILDSITFTETRKYVEHVVNNYKKYKRIYEEVPK